MSIVIPRVTTKNVKQRYNEETNSGDKIKY